MRAIRWVRMYSTDPPRSVSSSTGMTLIPKRCTRSNSTTAPIRGPELSGGDAAAPAL